VQIFTVIFPPIAYGFLGHSRQGAVGPMSIPCLIIAAVVDKHAGIESTMEDRVEITMALTWMIGLIMLLAGFLRLGLLINFISKTVLTGFVHASAFMVCASMTPKLLGVSIEKSPVIYETVPRTWDVLPNAKLRSLLLSAGGIVLLLALNALKSFAKRKVSEAKEARRKKELQLHPQGDHDTHADTPQAGACCRGLNIMFTCFSPVMIFVVVMVSVGAHMCDYERLPEDSTPGTGSDSTSIEHVTTVCDDIKMVGDLPFGWPGVRWEWWERLGIDLLWDAGSISMVILAEHVSNVKLYSSVHDYEVCMSAELMSIGLTNCIGSLFSSFAVGARCECNPSSTSTVPSVL
jgi:MFS superfamily sulfate permease-like transporter